MNRSTRHVSQELALRAGEAGSGVYKNELSIGGVDIDPAFDYRIENLHFTAGNYFADPAGSRGYLYLSFFFLPSDSAQYVLDQITQPATSYSFNGTPSSTSLELSVGDMSISGVALGNNFNNYLAMVNNTGSGEPSFFTVPKIYAYHASLFGTYDFQSPYQQTHRDFYLPKTQFRRLYFAAYAVTYAWVLSTDYYVNGMVNFDLIQQPPEAA